MQPATPPSFSAAQAALHPRVALNALWALPVLCMALLAGCASGPRSGPAAGRDGPEANPPPGLETVPDAEPRVEPLRSGGPNKPYEVLGRSYTPITTDRPLRETGLASWYGLKFHGRSTASGEIYDMYAMTAAHKTMPLPSYARVRNPANGREIVVRVNDRGPFHAGRIIDLSYTAALKLGVLRGVATVEVERLTHDDIRAGVWRGVPLPAAAEVPAPPASTPPVPAPALALADATTPSAVLPAPSAGRDEPAPRAAQTTPRGGFWLQLGAYRERGNATALHRQVQRDADWLAPMLAVFSEQRVFRVQAGPFSTRAEAQGVAERLQGLLPALPLVTERR